MKFKCFLLSREKAVTYLNEYAEFVDPHTLRTVNKKGKERTVTSDKFIIATGGRPRYPGIPGDKVHIISLVIGLGILVHILAMELGLGILAHPGLRYIILYFFLLYGSKF